MSSPCENIDVSAGLGDPCRSADRSTIRFWCAPCLVAEVEQAGAKLTRLREAVKRHLWEREQHGQLLLTTEKWMQDALTQENPDA